MFGFSMGRVGPTDQTLSLLATAARRFKVQSAPNLAPVQLPEGYVDHLRSLPRAEVVTTSDVSSTVEAYPSPSTKVSDLLLPAREFLIEMEPLPTDFASTRIVQVRHLGDGVDEKLVVTIISRIVDRPLWSITIPGTMTALNSCWSDPARIQIAPVIGYSMFKHEMACAAFGIAVVAARQREMLGIVP